MQGMYGQLKDEEKNKYDLSNSDIINMLVFLWEDA